MKVQRCPSCHAGYSVDRLEPGATFECRRCHATVEVTATGTTGTSVSFGLLVAGLLAWAGLVLYANPQFGVVRSWPWEHFLHAETTPAVRANLAIWAFVGLWAILTALIPSFQRRSLPTLALGLLALLLASSAGAYGMSIELPRTLPWMLGVVALASGFTLVLQDRFGLATRLLLLSGGLVLIWLLASHFLLLDNRLVLFGTEMRALIDGTLPEAKQGSVYLWGTLAPQLGVLLAAVLAILVGLGLRWRALAWVGGVVLVAAMLLPGATRVGLALEGEAFGIRLLGTSLLRGVSSALVEQGVALWLILTLAAADLVRSAEVPS